MRIEKLNMSPVKETIGLPHNQPKFGQDVAKPFSEFLTNALNTVGELENKSKQTGMDFMLGKIEDVSEVMIASEKAVVALQLTMRSRSLSGNHADASIAG